MKELLGYSSSKTTEIYTSCVTIANVGLDDFAANNVATLTQLTTL